MNNHFDRLFIKNTASTTGEINVVNKILILFFLGLPVLSAFANTDSNKKEYYEAREDGWHWYEDPPEEKVVEELVMQPVALSASPSSEKTVEPLSAEWIRKMLPVLRDGAIDNPTKENVAAYFYAQRIMMDKAQVFSDVAQNVVTNDPLLDENLRLPFASAAKVSYLQSAKGAKKTIVDLLSDKAALWVFYDNECSYCKDQIGPINKLAIKHGITLEVIHKQGGSIPGLDKSIKVRKDNGQFVNLGVNFTPAIMMVSPPDGYWLISQGFTAYDVLVDRLVAAANEYGLITKEQYLAALPTRKGILHSSEIESQNEVNWDSPQEWVPFIRKQIGKTYGLEFQSGEHK